jgi:hypothetical protein
MINTQLRFHLARVDLKARLVTLKVFRDILESGKVRDSKDEMDSCGMFVITMDEWREFQRILSGSHFRISASGDRHSPGDSPAEFVRNGDRVGDRNNFSPPPSILPPPHK